jgi:Collagen triple helix repeat (20 copies)
MSSTTPQTPLRRSRVASGVAAAAIAVSGAAFAAAPAGADTVGALFEAPKYQLGNINGQDGWLKTNPNFDVAVAPSSPIGSPFGAQSLRISDAVTSGSFGDQTFSKEVVDEAGESIADSGGMSGGIRRTTFNAQWKFSSTQSTVQEGLGVTVSADRGDGARMTWVRMEDHAAGMFVYFVDYSQAGGFISQEEIAGPLDRTQVHSIREEVEFVDGPGNDIVRVYVDGVLERTGTTWEDYFRFDPEQTPSGNKVPTVDSLLFRVGGTSHPAFAGKGFLVDDVRLESFTPGPGGPAGPKGDTGDTGSTGPKGDTGSTGPKGDTGANGANGANGSNGADGAAGPQGPTGPQGPAAPRTPTETTSALAAVSTSSARATSGGQVPVKLKCAASGVASCQGSLRLRLKGQTVGTASFTIPAGKRGTVSVQLSRSARKALSLGKPLSLTAQATTSTGSSPVKTLTVKPATARRR